MTTTQLKRNLSLYLILSAIGCFNQGCDDSSSPPHEYLEIVKAYADTMIEFGRDRYGATHSPLFAAALDPETLSLFEGERLQKVADIDRATWGIRKNDRVLTGSNPMHDQNLYQILYALSALTGDERYAEESDKALKWFFEHCQSPVTGLMTWGEHMGWDFRTETVMKHLNVIGHSVGEGMTHEFYRPWVLWERSFELHPDASTRFALGLWNHQIYDQKTGNFSRHAKWDQHRPGRNYQFPRHGGFYIATWAEAYFHSNDDVFLLAIETLLNMYKGMADKETGAVPQEFGASRTPENNLLRPMSNLSLAIDLWDASLKVPEPLAGRMGDFASRLDSMFNRMNHKVGPGGEGFIALSNTRTLEPEDIRAWRRPPGSPLMPVYSDLWAAEYGAFTDANMGVMCYVRYKQSKHEGYKNLILLSANRYLNSEPEIEFPIYPGTLGTVIYLMIGAWELSRDAKYLDRAVHFAEIAIQMFGLNESALPAASSRHDHYEAVTQGDTLMMALLKLHVAKNGLELKVPLVWNDR